MSEEVIETTVCDKGMKRIDDYLREINPPLSLDSKMLDLCRDKVNIIMADEAFSSADYNGDYDKGADGIGILVDKHLGVSCTDELIYMQMVAIENKSFRLGYVLNLRTLYSLGQDDNEGREKETEKKRLLNHIIQEMIRCGSIFEEDQKDVRYDEAISPENFMEVSLNKTDEIYFRNKWVDESFLIKLTNMEFDLIENYKISLDKFKRESFRITNLGKIIKYFGVTAGDDFLEILRNKEVAETLKNSNPRNFSILLDIAEFQSTEELALVCNNSLLRDSLSYTNYSVLNEMFDIFESISEGEKNKNIYDILMHSYNAELNEQASEFTRLSGVFKSEIFENFMIGILQDEDYVHQNMHCVNELLKENMVSSDVHVENLKELKDRMGGFMTPKLSKRYSAILDRMGRDSLIEKYKKMMAQVLSSGKIDIEDTGLLAEVIFLAYRPTGYTVSEIEKMLGRGSLKDLNHHLENISFEKTGYEMDFEMIHKFQTQGFDEDVLETLDKYLLLDSLEKENLIRNALSMKKGHENALPMLLGFVMRNLEDDRFQNYRNTYHSGKGVRNEFDEERLESLAELLKVLPKEPEFESKLRSLLSEEDVMKANAVGSADAYLWKKRKGIFSPEERTVKNKIDETIKALSKDMTSNVHDLVSAIPDIDPGLSGESLFAELNCVRREKFLGYAEEQDFFSVYYAAILEKAKELSASVKKEAGKIETIKSGEYRKVKAVISKNVGSYFAKAGAEICTSHNMRMWNEERHVHMNLVYENQIIGNVMLYFEPERDYMVARGFNPRKDTMARFDRFSIAKEITRVIHDIAKENGYKEVYIPGQSGWHALSNRDGMVKEMSNISKRTIEYVKSKHHGQRTHIRNADFYVTQKGGTPIQNLNLLCLVEK